MDGSDLGECFPNSLVLRIRLHCNRLWIDLPVIFSEFLAHADYGLPSGLSVSSALETVVGSILLEQTVQLLSSSE